MIFVYSRILYFGPTQMSGITQLNWIKFIKQTIRNNNSKHRRYFKIKLYEPIFLLF